MKKVIVTVLVCAAIMLTIVFVWVIPQTRQAGYDSGTSKYDSVFKSGQAVQKKSSDSTITTVRDSVIAYKKLLAPKPKKVYVVKAVTAPKEYTAEEIWALQTKNWAAKGQTIKNKETDE